MATRNDVQKLLAQARTLDDGPTKVALLDEAVQRADILRDLDWQLHTRSELIEACFTGGDPERMLVALSWSLAKNDELRPGATEQRWLWGCKYALSYIAAFPHISQAQIHALRDDTLQRFQRSGASARVPHLYGMYNELCFGYPERAAPFRTLWRQAPRDLFTEPPDWELYFDALYFHLSDATDKALELGVPMIDGRQHSDKVSFWMVDMLLLELLKRGERKLSLAAHRQARRQCAQNPKYIDHMGVHLTFAALTGNIADACDLLQKNLPVALSSRVPSGQFGFFLNAWNSAEHLHALTGKPAHLRFPQAFPLWNADGVYDWSELAHWFATQAHVLEAQFNTRNGNDLYTTYFTKALQTRAAAQEWPSS